MTPEIRDDPWDRRDNTGGCYPVHYLRQNGPAEEAGEIIIPGGRCEYWS